MDRKRAIVEPATSIAQCFQTWKTGRGIKHKGPHVCIKDRGHERACLCACGSQRRETQ